MISGGEISTYAVLDSSDQVREVGANIPMSIIRTMPPNGTGPSGAIAALKYPADAQIQTFFNTMVIQSNQAGHPGPY